jgi:hypothetical protein
MKLVEIRNKDVLDILQNIKYNYITKWSPSETNMKITGPDGTTREDWISHEFLDKLMSIGRKHDGSPPAALSYALKPDHYDGKHKTDYSLDYMSLDAKLKERLGLDCCALSQLYPPGGYIGWHTNENASAHNLLFTWSETGDGYFEYVDPETKEIVRMKDKKGWSCKAGYFGSKNQPEKIVYHAASTDCWRITVSYTLGHNFEYWQDVIEDISTE